MDVTRTLDAGVLHMRVDGRIDGYWADHLDEAISAAVAEGHHQIALDCSAVSFLSSAGIGVLVKHHKQLAHIKGGLHVVRRPHQDRHDLVWTGDARGRDAPGRGTDSVG